MRFTGMAETFRDLQRPTLSICLIASAMTVSYGCDAGNVTRPRNVEPSASVIDQAARSQISESVSETKPQIPFLPPSEFAHEIESERLKLLEYGKTFESWAKKVDDPTTGLGWMLIVLRDQSFIAASYALNAGSLVVARDQVTAVADRARLTAFTSGQVLYLADLIDTQTDITSGQLAAARVAGDGDLMSMITSFRDQLRSTQKLLRSAMVRLR